MNDYAEANISTQQPPPGEDARLPRADGHEGRPPGAQKAPGQGPQAPDAFTLLGRTALSQRARLRNSTDFRSVYENGRRFDGRLMTVFILPNEFGQHRLGITASRKMSRLAVKRNRAKRLIREAFRQSAAEMQSLRASYDWVFNTRRALLEVKAGAVLEELRGLIARLKLGEKVSEEKAGL